MPTAKKAMTIYLDEGVYARLAALAKHDRRSVSQAAALYIEEGMADVSESAAQLGRLDAVGLGAAIAGAVRRGPVRPSTAPARPPSSSRRKR